MYYIIIVGFDSVLAFIFHTCVHNLSPKVNYTAQIYWGKKAAEKTSDYQISTGILHFKLEESTQ